MKNSLIFGIDEAGRGPLAGPVAVCVFGMKKDHKLKFQSKRFPKGKDSKKMSEVEREFWHKCFLEEKKMGKIYFEYAFSPARLIDKKGIVFAVNKAMETCFKKLIKRRLISVRSEILLDGALHAPARFLNQKTIIRGDEKKTAIAAASIIAKVERDNFMRKMAKKYPVYGFERHKGYGTLSHRKMAKKHGFSPIHRKTFMKSFTV